MSAFSRRKLISTVATGAAGFGAGAYLANRYGLVPPGRDGIYALGDTLTYASHRLLTGDSLAKEFSHSQISKSPFANGRPLETDDFKRLEAGGFADWRVNVDGMVANPLSLSLDDIRSFPATGHITQLACEEGWSFIAEWVGVTLSHVLELAEALPQARYVVYFSMQGQWMGSIDMADALHPQTLLTYAMNGGDLPVGHGGPLRVRVPRQLGYKSVKYVNRLTVTNSLAEFEKPGSYSWYAGI